MISITSESDTNHGNKDEPVHKLVISTALMISLSSPANGQAGAQPTPSKDDFNWIYLTIGAFVVTGAIAFFSRQLTAVIEKGLKSDSDAIKRDIEGIKSDTTKSIERIEQMIETEKMEAKEYRLDSKVVFAKIETTLSKFNEALLVAQLDRQRIEQELNGLGKRLGSDIIDLEKRQDESDTTVAKIGDRLTEIEKSLTVILYQLKEKQ